MRIKQATKQGWIEYCDNGVFVRSYPTSKYRRGRVQGGGMICPALTTQSESNLIKIETMEVSKLQFAVEWGGILFHLFEREDKSQHHDVFITESAMGQKDVVTTTIEDTTIIHTNEENVADVSLNTGIALLYDPESDKYYRIRKLTPRECFRLMGVREPYIDILENCGVAKSKRYQLAGNSIVVDCLVGIFENMFINTQPEEGLLF